MIADESVNEDDGKCGSPRCRIIPTGIPVSRDFLKKEEKEEAKKRLQINKRNRHLLVMCGSMGCGPIKTLLWYLVKGLPEDMEVSVICGTNKRLYKQLSDR